MTKKLLSTILVVCMCITIFGIVPVSAEESDFSYIVSSKTVVITGYYSTDVGKVIIPETIGGRTVIGISPYAFENKTNITGVVLPNTITSIGNDAFRGCTNLEKISIPGSVLQIGNNAFRQCSGLESVNISEGVMSIGRECFRDCSALKSITLPNSLTFMGDSVFYDCCQLNNVIVPNNIKSIEDFSFGHCYELTNITLPNNVKNIGYYAFGYCNSLSTVYYNGTEEEYDNVGKGILNDGLISAQKIFFHYVDFDGYSAKISDVENGDKVILALYKDKTLTDMQTVDFKSENIEFTSSQPYDKAKIFAWKDLINVEPVIDSIVLTE